MLVAIGQLIETDREAMADQDWFLYNYKGVKIMVLREELSLVHRSASGAKVR